MLNPTQLRKLEAEATPGPWCWEPTGEKVNEYVVGTGYLEDGTAISGEVPKEEWVEDAVLSSIGYHEASTVNYTDPRLIVAMRNQLIPLLDRLSSAEKALAFYADAEGYCGDVDADTSNGTPPEICQPPVWDDGGALARAHLAEFGGDDADPR